MLTKILKITVLFIAICALAIPFIQSSYAADTKVIITGITGEGDVQVLRPGSQGWIPAQENMALNEGDVIMTGANSGASIKYDDGAIIDLVKESRFTVAQLRDVNNLDKQQNVLSLETGYLHGLFEKIPDGEESRFVIKTPTAVCGVLGTKIYIDADTGTVYVTEGTLTIINTVTGETYTVTAGNSITINTNGSTSGAQPYSEAAIKAIEDTFVEMDIDILGYSSVTTGGGESIIQFTPGVDDGASAI